jgi:DNA-binding winged helix-turn-helix (wHTH) protein
MVQRFGELIFDRERRQLLQSGGDELHLTPKAFDLLALLIDEAPRVVSKTELHERLWPGVFVSDAALAVLIKELRRVVRESGTDEEVIRTSHGVGYSFALRIDRASEPRTPAAHWVVTTDRHIALAAGENLIGRDPACVIWLDAAGVSRCHARIVVERDHARLEDLGSKNGTMLRDEIIATSTVLCDGDTIRVGPIAIVYRWSTNGMSTETLKFS